MKSIAGKREGLFMEIAFAAERVIERVRKQSGRFTGLLDSLFTAVTFAEAGEFETAPNIMGGGPGNRIDSCTPGVCLSRA